MELRPLKIRFFLKKSRSNKGKFVIFMRLILASKTTDISLGYTCAKSEWDENEQMLKLRHPDRSYVLNLTNDFRKRALEIYQHYFQRGISCSVFDIKYRLTKNSNGFVSITPTILELFDRAITRKKVLSGKNNTKSTITKYDRCKAHIFNFIKVAFKTNDFDCNQIDLRFIEDFEIYLKTEGGCCHNTSMKYIQNFKTIFRSALAYGYANLDPFINYKIRLDEVHREYLTEEDIQKLIDFDCKTAPSLPNVRDLFIFSCYTGLSYIDIANLTLKNIAFEEGTFWIKTRREKTGIKSNIPLLDVPLVIVKQHCPEFGNFDLSDTKLLKVISNQKINEKLKIIAMMCGINKHLTFHLARHTFATTVTLNNGVPIESVSSMLGHKHISTTQHYAKLLDKKVGEDMVKLRALLHNKVSKTKTMFK